MHSIYLKPSNIKIGVILQEKNATSTTKKVSLLIY